MNSTPHNRIDAEILKARADLLAIIGRTVDLKPRGQDDWWGCCPFHAEQTPSFHVQPARGLWKCFGCGQGGDVFEFVRRLHHTDFPGALAILAEELHITTAAPPSPPPTAVPLATKQEDAWRRYLQDLQPLPGTSAAAYLEARGIALELAMAVGTRFHPAWSRQDGHPRPAAVYPLRDAAGELVAIEGRHLDTEPPKTICRGRKSQGLFATLGAWMEDPLILTEGYADALSLAACGCPALALCGVKNHPRWLPEACQGKTVVLAFDQDAAGIDGTRALAELLLAAGVATFALPILDQGRDLNGLLLKYGRATLAAALAAALPRVRPAGDPFAGRRVRLPGATGPGTVTCYHPPDVNFIVGWAEVRLDDGRTAQTDACTLRDADTGQLLLALYPARQHV